MTGRDWVQPHQWGRILAGFLGVAFLMLFAYVLLLVLTLMNWSGFSSEQHLEEFGTSLVAAHKVGGSVEQLRTDFVQQGGRCNLEETLLSCWKSEPGALLTRFTLELYAHQKDGVITEPITAFVQEWD